MTPEEIKRLWKTHESDPPGSVFIYKGQEILVDYLKHLHQHVINEEKRARTR